MTESIGRTMSGSAVFLIIGAALLVVIFGSIFVFRLTRQSNNDQLDTHQKATDGKHKSDNKIRPNQSINKRIN